MVAAQLGVLLTARLALWAVAAQLPTWLLADAASPVRRERPSVLAIDSVGSLAVGGTSAEECTDLTNHGSYFSVAVKVGTSPGKTFDVVADTGSDSVIVTSCQCAITGSCDSSDKCLKKDDSKTLQVNETSDGRVPIVVMAFGSGQVEAEVGSDKVTVAGVEASMNDQLLLMVDKALNLKGPFEGILGLGIPEAAGNHKGHSWTSGRGGVRHKANNKTYVVKSFLEEAGITRFAMCFKDVGNGTLRLNTPALTNPLGSVGVAHWGLDFRGISVGGESTPAKFCTASGMKAGQTTPCGIIPDSGTTLIMGPKDQLVALYEDICDQWPRCKQASDAGLAQVLNMEKFQLLEVILANCSGWVKENDENALDELPELNFHLRGKKPTDGGAAPHQTLAFKGSDYVEIGYVDDPDAASSFASRTTLSQEPFHELLHRRSLKPTGTLICLPAMGTMEYLTKSNGPVWILGTPLFYAFKVSYDLGLRPPAISIDRSKCSDCSGGSAAGMIEAPRPRFPGTRRIRGRARGPSQPLHGPL